MRPDEDQLGDYKAAMENLKNVESCDSCGKKIERGTGYSITTKQGIQSFHKDANDCANAPDNARDRVIKRGVGGTGKAIGRNTSTSRDS